MRAPALLALTALAAIAGCRETHHCDVGNSYQNGQCLPFGDASGLDAGRDGGSDDAGNDVGHDAFDYCAACSDGSVCFDGTWDAGDAGRPPGCVECVTDTQCDAVVLPLPDGGGADGGMPRGAAICEDFRCVLGCRRDADCGTTGVCRPDHRCSAYPAYSGTSVACAPCDTDGNCNASGFLCVRFDYQNGAFMHLGEHYCLQHAAACDTSTAPLDIAVTPHEAASIDGVSFADALCGPATSCEALLDTTALRPCSGTTVECGLVGTADGLCSTTNHCTIRCVSTDDCPSTAPRCQGTTTVCVP